jgi:hypothetical protein
MIEIVVNETEKIFCKAIKTFSKKDMLDQTQVSFLLSLTEVDGENVVKYELCHEHIPVRETNIKEILGVKTIDFKGYTYFVPPKIKQILEDFCKSLNSKNVEIVVYLNREDEDKIRYFLYNETQYIKEFFLGDVLKIEQT